MAGACMHGGTWPGVCVAGVCAWLGGMHGRGACIAEGACMVGGMHGRVAWVAGGHAWWGGFMVDTTRYGQ